MNDKLYDAVSRILIWQTVISGILALAIIGAAALIPIMNALNPGEGLESSDEIRDWGGVIIGFYFGSALTQMGALIRSISGQPNEAPPAAAPPQPPAPPPRG